MILITLLLLFQSITDTFQYKAHIPPVVTYLFEWIILISVGWSLYLWPSSANWKNKDRFPLYRQDILTWIFTHMGLWIFYALVSLIVFVQIGFTYWPILTDIFSIHPSNLVYFLTLLLFGISLITLGVLWDVLWADIKKCYSSLEDIRSRIDLPPRFKTPRQV